MTSAAFDTGWEYTFAVSFDQKKPRESIKYDIRENYTHLSPYAVVPVATVSKNGTFTSFRLPRTPNALPDLSIRSSGLPFDVFRLTDACSSERVSDRTGYTAQTVVMVAPSPPLISVTKKTS